MARGTLIFVFLSVVSLSVTAQKPPARNIKQSPLPAKEIAKKTIPSVVLLVTKDAEGKPTKLGTGFFVDKYTVVTNYHIIKGASAAYAKPGNTDYEDEVLGTVAIDAKSDLALLKIDTLSAGLVSDKQGKPYGPWHPPVRLAKTSRLEVGDEVYVVGNPEGLESTFSQGIVSSLRGDDYIQITAPISRGSSGGPVLNRYGEVIGIAVGAIEEGQNLNFAIPIAKLRNLLSNVSKVSPLRPSTESAPTTPKAEDNRASREDTVAWLRTKLEGLHTYDSDGTEHRIKQLTVQLLSSDCELQLATSGQMGSTTVLRRYYVLLSVADRASSGSNNSGNSRIWLHFRSNIYETAETYEAGRLVRKRDDKVSGIALFTGDEELANRSAEAFNHLIKLCGGGLRKEPF